MTRAEKTFQSLYRMIQVLLEMDFFLEKTVTLNLKGINTNQIRPVQFPITR